MAIIEVKHPLLEHKIGLMRQLGVSTKQFRELASEIGSLLTYEVTRNLETEDLVIEGWDGNSVKIKQIKGKKITLVPILRAGLGLMEGVLQLIPSARVSAVGFYRDESTLLPVPYLDRVVDDVADRVALIVDPMVATGGSLNATIELLKSKGCSRIVVLCLITAPEGAKAVEKLHPDVDLYTAAMDDHLDERGYIVPGLGDAGDKLFGTK